MDIQKPNNEITFLTLVDTNRTISKADQPIKNKIIQLAESHYPYINATYAEFITLKSRIDMYTDVQFGKIVLSNQETDFEHYFAVSQVKLNLGSNVTQTLDLVVIRVADDASFDYIDYSHTVIKKSLEKLIIVVVSCTILFLIFVAYRLQILAKKITLQIVRLFETLEQVTSNS